jgi:hypothetical protein
MNQRKQRGTISMEEYDLWLENNPKPKRRKAN